MHEDIWTDLDREMAKSAAGERPDFIGLYRAYADELREENSPGGRFLLQKILLGVTAPDPHINDMVDSYTGEPLKICSRQCPLWFEARGQVFCADDLAALEGEICPRDVDIWPVNGTMTWLNIPMPGPAQGVGLFPEAEALEAQSLIATDSISSEDDLFDEYHTHWNQTFEEWIEYGEFNEAHRRLWEEYYEILTQQVEGRSIAAKKFLMLRGIIVEIVEDVAAAWVREEVGNQTVAAVIARLWNGCALNLRPEGARQWQWVHNEAALMREQYQQWINIMEDVDAAGLLPEPSLGIIEIPEDSEQVERWCELLEEQEKAGYPTEEAWQIEMAYRKAACQGGPKDARAAAGRKRRELREAKELAWLEAYH